jgi:hypothetical protein
MISQVCAILFARLLCPSEIRLSCLLHIGVNHRASNFLLSRVPTTGVFYEALSFVGTWYVVTSLHLYACWPLVGLLQTVGKCEASPNRPTHHCRGLLCSHESPNFRSVRHMISSTSKADK